MMASWVVYALAVSVLFLAAAGMLERGLRPMGLPVRWGWGVAMLGSVGVALMALVRKAPAATQELVSGSVSGVASGPVSEAVSAAGNLEPLVGSLARLATPPALPPALDPWVLGGWVALSVVMAVLVLRAFWSLVVVRRTWTRDRVDGRDVLIAEGFGPAVVGLIRPEIVLPRWALSMEPLERELMIRHEEEHLAARDVPLLATGLLLILAFPWNVPLWWLGRRLSLAVEIDCDRRVLRSTSGTRRYADLLLEMASRGWTPPLRALALARPIPFLERRIRAMTDTTSPRTLRTLAFASLSALLVFAACELNGPSVTTPDPTNAVDVPVINDVSGSSQLAILGMTLSPPSTEGRAFLFGTVVNPATGDSVGAAQVRIPSLDIGSLANTDGRFVLMNIPPGDHTVTLQHPDYGVGTARVVFGNSESDRAQVEAAAQAAETSPPRPPPPGVGLTPDERARIGTIQGTITEFGTGAAVGGATVELPGVEIGSVTNISGRFLMLNITPGTYTLRVQKEGFAPHEAEVVVTAGGNLRMTIELRR